MAMHEGETGLLSETRSHIERIESCIADIGELEIAYSREYPFRPSEGVPCHCLPIHPQLQEYLTNAYPAGLFTHQHDALKQVFNGHHIVVSTQTSSGKSLTFTVPAVNALLSDPFATSLFIYPQKALANDQFSKLREMHRRVCGAPRHEFTIARYDGGTPRSARPAIRKQGQLVLTNPDMLHYALLQYHDKWKDFFAKLRYVVIDEAHIYHGVLGTSVAYILRRLRSICHRYGSSPQFISSSATIDRPADHLRLLTGLPFLEIGSDRDGSVQGRKKVWLLRSRTHYYQLGRALTRLFVDRGLSCLTFCPSRISAERLVADFSATDLAEGRIRVYRAGLNTGEREEIEAGMKSAQVRGVFSTNALELGIDIGALDVAICVGLPNTMMSLWQRAGRVGRNGKEGGIVFIAADTPLDTYFSEHPEELFDRANEPLAVNLQNRRLVCHHLACSIQEMGDEDSVNTGIMGEDIERALELRKKGRLNEEVFYSDDPHMRTPIRSIEARNYKLMLEEDEIGEIDPWHLIREAYPHAVYLHGGRRYRVTEIFKSDRRITLVPERTRNLTDPRILKVVRTRRVRAVTEYLRVLVKMADFEANERLVEVIERNRNGDIVAKHVGSQGLAPHRLPTEGVSIELQSELCGSIDKEVAASSRLSVVNAIGRLIRSLFPVISGPCDTMDFDTFSEARPGKIAWYLYDRVHDGIDLTVRAYRRVPELFDKALDRVRSCKCEDDKGCFRCIRNPEEEEVSSKSDCVKVLMLLCAELSADPTEQVFQVDALEQDGSSGVCPACEAPVDYTANFCSNCGEALGV